MEAASLGWRAIELVRSVPRMNQPNLHARICDLEDGLVERKQGVQSNDEIRKAVVSFANSVPERRTAVLSIGVANDGTVVVETPFRAYRPLSSPGHVLHVLQPVFCFQEFGTSGNRQGGDVLRLCRPVFPDMVFPIGIWVIHPRVNRLFDKTLA
jgi:hypothetical protein